MKDDREYEIYKAIANYLRLQYPKVIYHFDYAGLYLTKAQAGKMKAIQGKKGWPDLFIAEHRGGYHGLFIEIKKEDEKLTKKDNTPISEHIKNQSYMINSLSDNDYYACFCVGLDAVIKIVDQYLCW